MDYRVDGTTVAESVRVQSQSAVESDTGLSVGTDLDAVTNFAGASLSTSARTETSATVTADSGAELTAHDNGHGTLVVAATDESQYVGLNLSSSASADSESDQRVVVTHEDATESVVLVAGDGSVTVTDDGNVTAEVGQHSRLVVRSYDQRDEDDRQQERLITNGTAAAGVYLTQQTDSDGEAAVDVVDYGQNTTVDVTQQSQGKVEMTVERTASEGRVVITSVGEQTFDSAQDVDVQVDGETAVEASSYGELAAATDGGPTSKYMVRQTASADASAEVLVALNHFSQRSVTMEETDESTDDSTASDETSTDDSTPEDDQSSDTESPTDGSESNSSENETPTDDGTASATGPGFTGLVTLLAVALALGLARRQS